MEYRKGTTGMFILSGRETFRRLLLGWKVMLSANAHMTEGEFTCSTQYLSKRTLHMGATREGVAAAGATGSHCTYQYVCYFVFLMRIGAVDCLILNIP